MSERLSAATDRADEDRPAPVRRPRPQHQHLLDLQRQAGNAAVTAALRAGGVQRQLFPPMPVVVQPGPARARTIWGVTCKRRNVDLLGTGEMGHWWTELGAAESYGWWPKSQGTVGDAIWGTEGELNAVSHGLGGTPTRDPYHGDTSEDTFHPRCVDPSRTDDAIAGAMRSFAQSYRGSWRWSFGGTDCHTFQEKLLAAAGCHEPTMMERMTPDPVVAEADPEAVPGSGSTVGPAEPAAPGEAEPETLA